MPQEQRRKRLLGQLASKQLERRPQPKHRSTRDKLRQDKPTAPRLSRLASISAPRAPATGRGWPPASPGRRPSSRQIAAWSGVTSRIGAVSGPATARLGATRWGSPIRLRTALAGRLSVKNQDAWRGEVPDQAARVCLSAASSGLTRSSTAGPCLPVSGALAIPVLQSGFVIFP